MLLLLSRRGRGGGCSPSEPSSSSEPNSPTILQCLHFLLPLPVIFSSHIMHCGIIPSLSSRVHSPRRRVQTTAMIRDESNVLGCAIGNANRGLLCETSPWGRAEHCMPVFAFKAAAAQTLQVQRKRGQRKEKMLKEPAL